MPIPDEGNRERALPVSGVLQRSDLVTWVLFDNGVIARLDADRALIDAFSIDVPVAAREDVGLRRAAVRPDGRTALVYGVRDRSNSFDSRIVLVELRDDGTVLRARSFGAATAVDDVQTEFFTNGAVLYRDDGSLLLAGESIAGADASSRCELMSPNDDGSIRFAKVLSPGTGACRFGAVAVAANDDVVITGYSGETFDNTIYTIVLDDAGEVRSSSAFQLDGEGLLRPMAITRLSTTGYLVTGLEVRSASSSGVFITRLDTLGVPLVASSLRTPEDISVGLPDAFVTNDGGVVFAALADWRDLADGRALTRFLIGKARAKDGSIEFTPASGLSTVTTTTAGSTLTTTTAPSTYAFIDSAAVYARGVVLRRVAHAFAAVSLCCRRCWRPRCHLPDVCSAAICENRSSA